MQTDTRAVTFTIPGRIGGKGRPRFVRSTGHAFTPQKTRNQEAMIRDLAAQAMAGRLPFEGPVWLFISIILTPPASWPRKRREAARFVTGKPDVDNIEKLAGDSLNSIAWRDDSQVAQAMIWRRYSLHDPESTMVAFGPLVDDGPFIFVMPCQMAEFGRAA